MSLLTRVGNGKTPARGAPPRKPYVREETLMGYLFLAPAAIVLLVLVGYPAVTGIWYSFSDKMIGFKDYSFVGLRNYIELLTDKTVWQAIFRGFGYAISTIIFKLPIGMAVALLLNKQFRGRGLARGLTLLPWSLPEIATVLVWSWMLNDLYGVFNFVLLKLHIIQGPIFWLGAKYAMPSIIGVNIWRGFPFFAINLLAGLQAIPGDLYEAATVDGATKWQAFWSITVPGLRTVIMIVSLLSFIWTSNDFTSIWVLTKGGPAGVTRTFPIITYETAFIGLQLGKASAVPVILLPVFGLLIVLLVKAVAGQEEDQ